MSRPFAVFDIDGTFIRWQLFHAVADELAERGLVPDEEYKKVCHARMQWKQRAQDTAYREYESQLVAMYDAVVTGLAFKTLESAFEKVFNEYKNQTYIYTRNLALTLKSKGYLLFAISGSQAEVVKLLAEGYGFDDYAGSTYEHKAGKLTGQRQILYHARKVEALNTMIAKFDATKKGSIAIGDSESDIPMLCQVETAIAFNPTQKLFKEARKQSWKVVIERKDVIYELEPGSGSYVLA